jgi:hypothetical protein
VRLGTAYPDKTGPHTAEAVFSGVEAFIIEGDTLGTINGCGA